MGTGCRGVQVARVRPFFCLLQKVVIGLSHVRMKKCVRMQRSLAAHSGFKIQFVFGAEEHLLQLSLYSGSLTW
ncbi:hypothetical protein M6B38_300915 [Iris pallida]|uniref:Uncharacterized protein n=1 Tax=Iris pallida TaxID=29817 RepID=A0AAX6HNC3_IRIPA|nr:hypothetical protein M6B38_300915 [Iris pallida]